MAGSAFVFGGISLLNVRRGHRVQIDRIGVEHGGGFVELAIFLRAQPLGLVMRGAGGERQERDGKGKAFHRAIMAKARMKGKGGTGMAGGCVEAALVPYP